MTRVFYKITTRTGKVYMVTTLSEAKKLSEKYNVLYEIVYLETPYYNRWFLHNFSQIQ
jgi:hypothetical protein